MESVEFLDEDVEGVVWRLICIVIVEGPVFIKGPIWQCRH